MPIAKHLLDLKTVTNLLDTIYSIKSWKEKLFLEFDALGDDKCDF